MIVLPSNETACRNVRGLNSPRTQEAVATFLKRHRLDVFCILETKIEDLANLHQILIERFGGWHATHNFECKSVMVRCCFCEFIYFYPLGVEYDHSPCVVEIKETGALAKRPFLYFNMWSSHPNFQNLVHTVWDEEVYGTRQFILCKKLKALKYPLKILNRREFSHISERAAAAQIKLERRINDAMTVHLMRHLYRWLIVLKLRCFS